MSPWHHFWNTPVFRAGAHNVKMGCLVLRTKANTYTNVLLGPTWETVLKATTAGLGLTVPFFSKEQANSMPFYVLDNLPWSQPGLGALSDPSQKSLGAGDSLRWRRTRKPHKTRRQFVFQIERAKTSLIVLNNVQQCHIYLCPSDVIFDTKTVMCLLPSPEFQRDLDKSLFFSTDIHWANSSRCQKHKKMHIRWPLLESSGDY